MAAMVVVMNAAGSGMWPRSSTSRYPSRIGVIGLSVMMRPMVPPTLLTGVTPGMAMYEEEVFGPVAALWTVDSLEEAIEIANSHPYGLGANLWSEDEGERAEFVRDVQSGMAFINGMTTSYPELPFGGVKQSGYGRELTELGMREFMNAKTVWIGPPSNEQGEGDTAAAASE